MQWASTNVSILLLLSTFVSCSGAKFTGSSRSKAVPTSQKPGDVSTADQARPSDPEEGSHLVSENFDVRKVQSKIDMIWLIDSSTSMGEEVAQVRKNFAAFMNQVASRSDLRLALIAPPEGPTTIGVSLNPQLLSAGHIQIPEEVSSSNALALAASMICREGETHVLSGGPRKICGQDASQLFISDSPTVTKVSGRLTSFLRPDSEKVIVVVTDDNPVGVTESNFLPLVAPYMKPKIFGFAGITQSPSCFLSSIAQDLVALARLTQGAVYDICSPDWVGNFDSLAQSTTTLASRKFTLTADGFKAIAKVEVDGKELQASEYLVDKNIVEISGTSLTAANSSVRVTVEVR